MQHITIDDQAARLIVKATGCIEIRDRHGTHLGYVAHGFSEEDVAVAKRRQASNDPRYTTPEVLDHLRSLEQE